MSRDAEVQAIVMSVKCPDCRAEPGRHCRTATGKDSFQSHASREAMVRDRVDDLLDQRRIERRERP